MDIINKKGQQRNWKTVSEEQPCEICGKADWCSREEDGPGAICRREGREGGLRKTDQSGADYWLYQLGNRGPVKKGVETFCEEAIPRADVDTLHKVYSGLLQELTLSAEHVAALEHRGLDLDAYEPDFGYRTLDKNRGRAVGRMVEAGLEEFLERVPGFVLHEPKDRTAGWILKGKDGLLIPVRDCQQRIIALLVRPDKWEKGSKYLYVSSKKAGGAGPGNPAHVPLFQGNTETVRVTEGVLKADIATALGGLLTIGLPGVNGWQRAEEILRDLGAKTVRLAFDADARKKRVVAGSLRQLANSVAKAGYKVELEVWNIEDGKGIDDLLAAGKEPKIVSGQEVTAEIEAIVVAAVKADPSFESSEMTLPAIQINGRQLSSLVDESWWRVLEANQGPQLFLRDGALVQLREKDGIPYLHPMAHDDLYGHLIRIADWVGKNDEGEHHARPPKDLLGVMLAYPHAELPGISPSPRPRFLARMDS